MRVGGGQVGDINLVEFFEGCMREGCERDGFNEGMIIWKRDVEADIGIISWIRKVNKRRGFFSVGEGSLGLGVQVVGALSDVRMVLGK